MARKPAAPRRPETATAARAGETDKEARYQFSAIAGQPASRVWRRGARHGSGGTAEGLTMLTNLTVPCTDGRWPGNRGVLPYDKAQKILNGFIGGGARLKYVEANMSLPNNDDAQLGGWNTCDDKPVLNATALTKVLTAPFEAAFQLAVQALPSCGDKPIRTIR
jgi:hypothetical protein